MKLSEYVAAFEQGKTVQFQTGPCGDWHDMEPKIPWYPSYTYRLKPKPLECWANVYPDGGITYYSSELQASRPAVAVAVRLAVHMVEAPNETK